MMRRNHTRELPSAACVPKTVFGLLVACGVAAWAPAQSRLSYGLVAGDHLVYEYQTSVRRSERDPTGVRNEREQAPPDGAHGTANGITAEPVPALVSRPPSDSVAHQIQLWCLQRTGSESLLLVELRTTTAGRTEPPAGLLVYVDESGRRRWPDEMPTRVAMFDPALDLLPALPLAVASTGRWDAPPDLYGRTWQCTNERADAAQRNDLRIAFRVTDKTGVADLLGHTRAGRFWFDAAAGLVTRLESDEQAGHGSVQTHATATLHQKITHSAQWADRRTAEAGRFLRTLRHEDRLLHEILLSPQDVEQSLAQLDRLWSAFRSDVDARTDSPFAVLADGRRQRLRADAERLRAWAALSQRWINQPARPWSLQDLGGTTLTSETTRRDVVIECFWSANSIWGLRALESFRQLAAAKVAGVQVLCYNMDPDVSVARAAVQCCGQGLPQILGGPLQVAEPLPEFPVVRVLDQSGRVRDMWTGWHPDYAGARESARQIAAGQRG